MIVVCKYPKCGGESGKKTVFCDQRYVTQM